ncbi:MAG: hypothetical protein ACREFP_10630 [Acetobacteraceae bacterium]
MAASAAMTTALAQDQTGAAATPAPAAAPLAATAPGGSLPLLGSGPASAPGLLAASPSGLATPAPPVGVSVRLGDVGQVLSAASAVGAVPVVAPSGLTITPSLGVSEEFNSNIFNSVNDRRSDFITQITPAVLATLSTPWATGTLSYAPEVQFFAENPSENNVGQYLNGSFNATLLPQTLLLSLGAYASQGSTSGGVVPGGASVATKGNRTTTTGFYVQPTFEHRFADIGTLQLGYTLQYSSQSGSAAFAPGAAQPFFVGSHALANQGSAIFTTGPVLGRFNNTVTGLVSEDSGTGILDGAHQYMAIDTLRFAVERRVYVFGTIGYENIFYPSVPVVEIEDGVWAVGFNLTPAPGTSITAGYGRIEGLEAPFLQAVISLTPRTTLAASYSNTLGSSLQFLQYALTNSLVDAAGNPIASATGTPILLGNQLLSVQSGLSRNAIFSASLTTTWPRDTVSVGLFNEQQKLIANAPGVTGFSQNSWSGSVTWTHVLTPVLTAASYFQLGETNSRAVGSGASAVVAGQVSLAYNLTPTLTGTLLYGISNDSFPDGNALQNIVMVALQKTF